MGLLGWAVGLPAAIVVSGVAMALLGVFVAVRFPEDNFMPARGQHWAASLLALRRGVALARRGPGDPAGARGDDGSQRRGHDQLSVRATATSDVRATIHSFLSQAETAGEIAGGWRSW
jgi:hypothetical protein